MKDDELQFCEMFVIRSSIIPVKSGDKCYDPKCGGRFTENTKFSRVDTNIHGNEVIVLHKYYTCKRCKRSTHNGKSEFDICLPI